MSLLVRHSCVLSPPLVRHVESGFGNEVSKLPTRWLPPGCCKMLFWQFTQDHPGISCLGYFKTMIRMECFKVGLMHLSAQVCDVLEAVYYCVEEHASIHPS